MNEDSNYLGNEMWKTHPSLSHVEVSTLGRVKVFGKLKTPTKQPGNNYYWRVSLGSRKLGKRRRHRLVGETWLNVGPDECVLHKNEELPPELIDSVDNLWVGNRIDNYKDRDRKGRLIGKKKNIIPQDVRKKVLSLQRLGLHHTEISDMLNLTCSSVYNIYNRDTDTNNYINDWRVA